MRLFFDPRQSSHASIAEMHNGGFVEYREHPGRIENVLGSIGVTEHLGDSGLGPIAAVHSGDYLEFLLSAHSEWLAAGRSGDALPYVWPVRRRRDLRLERIDARPGRYSFDATTPVTATTWSSAYSGAQTALRATRSFLARDRRGHRAIRNSGGDPARGRLRCRRAARQRCRLSQGI